MAVDGALFGLVNRGWEREGYENIGSNAKSTGVETVMWIGK